MNIRRPQQFFLVTASLLATLLLVAGCRPRTRELALTELTAGERLYCERVIALERAKSVALIHRDIGEVLLDSLATAWGDSVIPTTMAGMPSESRRAIAVGELLARILRAEQDSLRWEPGANRLHLPLPDPDRPGRERPVTPTDDPSGATPRT